jgi:hypothetical protein
VASPWRRVGPGRSGSRSWSAKFCAQVQRRSLPCGDRPCLRPSGNGAPALDLLRTLVRPLELAPGWMPKFTRMACDAASAVWLLNHVEEIEVIERNLRQKVVAPDFRYPMQDGRLSLARLCALRGRYDEAAYWFAQSRAVLEQQGARPLRAIADLDEAIMYLRRNEDGDRHRAAPLLSAAIVKFRALGMTGWLRRAERLAS